MHPVVTQWHTEALLAERRREAADQRLARSLAGPRRRQFDLATTLRRIVARGRPATVRAAPLAHGVERRA